MTEFIQLNVQFPCREEDYIPTSSTVTSAVFYEMQISLQKTLPILYKPNQSYDILCQEVHHLWRLSHNYETKCLLLQSQYHLLEFFFHLLSDETHTFLHLQDDPEEDLTFQAIGCIWYLSRSIENRAVIGQAHERYLPILPLLMKLIEYPKYTEMIMNILLNCSLSTSNHNYLFSTELGYLAYLGQQFLENPDDSEIYRAVNYLSLSMDSNAMVETLHYHHIPRRLLNRLVNVGIIPSFWPDRYGGPEYWAFNVMMDLSLLSTGAKVLKEIQAAEYFMALLSENTRNRFFYRTEHIKAMIILLNIWYYCDYLTLQSNSFYALTNTFDSSNNRSSALSKFINNSNASGIAEFLLPYMYRLDSRGDTLIRFLLDIYVVTVDFPKKQKSPKALALQQKGWAFGIVTIRTALSTFHHSFVLLQQCHRSASINDSLIIQLLQDPTYLTTHLSLLSIYIQNEECIRFFEDTGYILAGGGKDDHFVVELILENVLQFVHDVDPCCILNEMNDYKVPISFEHLCQFQENAKQLLSLRSLNPERNIPERVTQLAGILIEELTNLLTSLQERNLRFIRYVSKQDGNQLWAY